MRSRPLLFVSAAAALVVAAAAIVWRVPLASGLGALRSSFTHSFGNRADYALCETMLAEVSSSSTPAIQEGDADYFSADVYSRYPWGDRSSVVVRGGSDDRLAPGMPAFVGEYFFGKVISVSRTQSEIDTIFSPAWRSSVYLGADRAKAVLYGGDVPSIELIAREAQATSSLAVINSDPSAPFGAPLGTLGSISGGEHDLWYSAPLVLPYPFDDVRSVRILKHFP